MNGATLPLTIFLEPMLRLGQQFKRVKIGVSAEAGFRDNRLQSLFYEILMPGTAARSVSLSSQRCI